MDIVYYGILLLNLVLLVYLGFRAVPLILVGLASGQIRGRFLDQAESDQIIAESASAQARLAELKAEGFTLLGIMAEKPWWQRAVLEVVTTSVEKSTFAGLVLTPSRKVAGLYFYTPLVDGGLVFTRSRSTLPEVENENTSVKNVPGGGTDKLWASHRRRLQALRERGQRPLPVGDQAARLAATRAYYTSAYAQRVRRAILRSSQVINFLLVLGLLLAIIVIYIFRAPVK